MLIDWAKLQMLVGPRFKRLLGERYDRERLARTKHAKTARKRDKRHATNQERSYSERMREARRVQKDTAEVERRMALKKAVAEYWSGEREDYPK